MSTLLAIIEKHGRELLSRVEGTGAKRIYGFSVPHFALFLLLRGGPFVAVEESPRQAQNLFKDLQFFRERLGLGSRLSAAFFAPPDSPEAVGFRARTLCELSGGSISGVISSREALRTGFSALSAEDSVLTIRRGQSCRREDLEEALVRMGYRPVSLVVDRGEFSQRGWLFDIYPSTEDVAVRVEFFGDEVELIRSFDIETQRSIRELPECRVFPSEEGERSHNIASESAILAEAKVFWAAKTEGFPETPEPPVVVSHLPVAGEGIDAGEEPLAGLGILPEERQSLEVSLASFQLPESVTMIVLASVAQAERLREIMLDRGIVAPIIAPETVASYEGSLFITTGNLSAGFRIPGLMVLTDREVFGERPSYRPMKRSRVSRLLLTLDDLKPGDFVVHRDHGIGRFISLQRQKTNEYEEDILTIEYAGGDRLYLPVHGIGRLQKYSAGEGHHPAVDRLGGKSWQKTTQRIKEKIKEMAGRILRLYAERKTARGYTFSPDTPLHREFDDFFPYEETPDQLSAMEKIRELMATDRPMELLLCGDVGYGKTEIAMRAAFRAVFDGRQVAVLVPTTLLAEQHYRTFRTRFSAFPVTVDYLSRFKKKQDVDRTVAALARGETDIVIGTHMLLNRKVCFGDLGLLIIDEEHRFGVAQKERLKELRKNVDVLTLTATPIPRTLHMSLSGIRELAVIETPPEERLAVKSLVTTPNDDVIREAIERELLREGQVFFVHNRIGDIGKVADYLKRLSPTARVAVAHGQMGEATLEGIMRDFLDRRANVLVCTSIIGSGLDIPTANTIIIDRADQFGLSDLYQLRGRVGRGSVQAFAYFLIPGEDILTEDAAKRIQAIREMSYLGAGFRLAMKDLEIRGTGNLLGAEQSGHIYKVGFEMYMDMLEGAVAELRGEEPVEEVEPAIQVRVPAFIPEDYIIDATLRLSFYRRLVSVRSTEALSDLSEEVGDRFGALPGEVRSLIEVMRLKLLARALYIARIATTQRGSRFYFVPDPDNRYRIPEDFFDKVLKVLFEMSSGGAAGTTGAVRFYPDGFELLMGPIRGADDLVAANRMLQILLDRSGPGSGA